MIRSYQHRLATDETESDTARMRAIKASANLLRDLQKHQKRPPASVAIPSTPIPLRIAAEQTSGCRSPAQACAELGWLWSRHAGAE